MKLRIGDQRMLGGHRVVLRDIRNGYLNWWDTVDKKVVTTTTTPKFDRKPPKPRTVMRKQVKKPMVMPSDEELARLADLNDLTIDEARESFL